jgi:hypothetical protein
MTQTASIAPDAAGTRSGTRRRLAVGVARTWLGAYAAVWAITLAAAGLVWLAGHTAKDAGRRVLGLTLTPARNPPPDAWHVLALAAHNIPIAGWPLLLGLTGLQRNRRARTCGDCLVLACMLANTIPVGVALGAYGRALVPYIPQLPLEWAGLATGYAGWLMGRRQAPSARERAAWLAVLCGLLIGAAVIETTGVPRR